MVIERTTATDFLNNFTRELLKADPMKRQDVIAEWSKQLDLLVTRGYLEGEQYGRNTQEER